MSYNKYKSALPYTQNSGAIKRRNLMQCTEHRVYSTNTHGICEIIAKFLCAFPNPTASALLDTYCIITIKSILEWYLNLKIIADSRYNMSHISHLIASLSVRYQPVFASDFRHGTNDIIVVDRRRRRLGSRNQTCSTMRGLPFPRHYFFALRHASSHWQIMCRRSLSRNNFNSLYINYTLSITWRWSL